MSLGFKLTENEKGQINAYIEQGLSISRIAAKIDRSRTVVRNYASCPKKYGTISNSGRPKAVSTRVEKHIFRLASNKKISSLELKDITKANVSPRTIRRYLGSSGFLVYKKLLPKPPLTHDHKKDRLNFAKRHHFWDKEWRNVVFSDEKKFNLDGPDGFQYYWHDLRKDKLSYAKRVQGGGSVMVWAAFSYNYKSPIVFISTSMNSSSYCHMLETSFLPTCPNNFIFQQDNAPCHRANLTQEWLEDHEILTLDWPSRSPDLNPIENLWGILVRSVYAGGRQFSSSAELRSVILSEWSKIDISILQKLIDSMKDRMFEVAVNQGGSTNY